MKLLGSEKLVERSQGLHKLFLGAISLLNSFYLVGDLLRWHFGSETNLYDWIFAIKLWYKLVVTSDSFSSHLFTQTSFVDIALSKIKSHIQLFIFNRLVGNLRHQVLSVSVKVFKIIAMRHVTEQHGFLSRNGYRRQFTRQSWWERSSVRWLGVIDGKAAELFAPGVLSHWPVDVLSDVFLFGLLASLGLNVAGNVFPIAIAKPGKRRLGKNFLDAWAYIHQALFS